MKYAASSCNSSILNMEAICAYKTSCFLRTERRYNPVELTLQLYYYIINNTHGKLQTCHLNPSFRSLSLFVCLLMALQPFVGPWPFFSFLIFYTVGRIPWTEDPPVARPLPAHRTAQTQNKHRHPCLKGDSNPRSQYLRGRRQFTP
jgi:hypothetical protein